MSNDLINENKINAEVTEVSNDVLPEINKSFCFVGEDFANQSFSVDLFVKRNRSKASLEQLKEDLSSYLRILKISMIELINEDYTDFVNLSTNLMGLDKAINNLSVPLRQLRDDGINIQIKFNHIIEKLETRINKLYIIRQNKSQLNKLITVMNGIERAEKWFSLFESNRLNNDNNIDNEKHWFSSIEKIALVIAKIETHFKSLDLNIPLVTQQLSARFELISHMLYENLESAFFSAITNNDRQQLESILRIYSLNGKHTELENMFRQKVVKPYMNEVICESFLDKYGINRFFQEILQFIDLKCQLIISINDENFSFIISSVWKEISNCLIIRTSSLFSAGNPDRFHLQYSSTTEFIDNFIIKSQIEKSVLESDPNYIELMNKFNTEVYFHIRFQQIATKFETSLQEHSYDYINDNQFKLFVTQTLYDCITTCWSPQTIFISHLFSSFWKLTLQLLSRYSFWLQNIKESDLKNASINILNETSVQNIKYSNQSIFLGLLVNDCEIIITKLKSFFDSNILVLKPTTVINEELNQSFIEALELVETNGLSNVVKLIKACLVSQCDAVLKQVNELPRLYRKTNKDVPIKASNYVNNCIDLITFMTSSETQFWKIQWTEDILREVTNNFKQFTSEVLISVQKIEDSLKRLKKAKNGNQSNQMKNNTIMSDDNKIRLQIYYDVEEFGKQV
jgi:hypothetical protein